MDTLSRELNELIESYHKQGKQIAVWGSGGKGVAALAITGLRSDAVAYVVDADPHKQGLFTPVSHLPVVGPEQLQVAPVDAIIITALAYRDEIVAQLREVLGFSGTIAVLGPHLYTV